jgi:hypothetical protein
LPRVSKIGRTQEAIALDAQHLPAVEAPQQGAIVQRAALQLEWLAQLQQHLRLAQQLIGEVWAVLEHVQHVRRQLAVGVQLAQQIGTGHGLLQKMFEAHAPAVQAGCGDRLGKLRRAVVQKTRQVAGRGNRFHFGLQGGGFRRQGVIHRFLRVDHALVDFAHRRQVLLQALLQGGGVEGLPRAIGGHPARQRLHARGVGGQRVHLAVLFHLQAMLQIAQELVGRREPRIFSGR